MSIAILDRERTVAGAGYNRWLIPPAALAVHLCIGEIYGFSVFNAPLTRIVGIGQSLKGRRSVRRPVMATASSRSASEVLPGLSSRVANR